MRVRTGLRRLVAAGVALGVAGSLLVAAPAVAEGVVHRAAGVQVVAGKYIVKLKKGRPGLTSAAGAVAAKYGGRVERTYQAAFDGFALSANEEQARKLAADPQVERVEADAIVRATGSQVLPPWDLDRVDQRDTVLNDNYRYADTAGAGVTVYVLDTGVRVGHTEFEGRASVGFDAVDDGWNGGDCSINGHGTHVSGSIAGKTYGVAKKARIVSVRVLGCEDFGTVSQIIAGVDWVTAHGQAPGVVNMSLGGGVSDLEDAALNNSMDAGFTYVVAAGNDDRDACLVSPARTPRAVTVGASNPVDERARDWKDAGGGVIGASNYGSCVDLFAPGESIKSAHSATDSATATLRGTSMASPHVAGAAALLLGESPNLTADQVSAALVNNATVGVLKADTLRTGSPNRLLYTAPPPRGQCSVSDDTRRPIPDLGAVTATLDVSACDRKVSGTARVRVRAQHPCRGDLSLRLIAPNDAERVLKEADSGDSAVDLDQTYQVGDLTTVDANGTWKLVVQDNFGFDEGALLGWSLTLVDASAASPVVSSTVYPSDGQPHGAAGTPGSFTFHAGDSVPVTKFSYQLDTAAPIEVPATGNEATVTITPATSGRRALAVRAFNAAGDPSAAVRYEFLVTDQAPPAPLVSSFDYPADGHPNGAASGTGVFTFKPGGAQPITKYTYQLDTDAQPREIAGTGNVAVTIAPAAGTRTLTVRAINGLAASSPTTYAFTVNGPASLIEAGVLAIDGAGVPTTIAADKAARFTFTAAAGDRLGLGVAANAISPSARLWVIDPTGRPFSLEPNQGPSYAITDSGRTIPLPTATTAGTYQVIVDPDGAGTGSATISLSRNLSGTTDTANQGYAYNLPAEGKIADLSFEAAAGAWYDFGFTDHTGGQFRSIDIFDPEGRRVGDSQLLFLGAGSIGRFKAPVSGRHRVLVGTYFGEPATGKLWLSNELAAGRLSTVSSGVMVPVDRPGRQIRFTFDGTVGQHLGLSYTNVTLTSGTPNAIVDPAGTALTPTGLGSVYTVPTLPRTGTYELLVNAGTGTGSFAVWLSQDNTGGALTTTGIGRTASASKPGQHTRYTFTGTAGQRLSVGLSSPSGGLDGEHVQLIRPDGTKSPVTWTGVPDSVALEVLPAGGTYELVVNPANTAVTGSVTVTLSTPADAGTATIGGAALTLPMTRPGQDGHLSFTGAVGDRFRLTFANSTFTNKTFALSIVKPDGTRLVDRAIRTDLTVYDLPTLPAAGPYLLIIDPAVAGTGSLTIGVTRTP